MIFAKGEHRPHRHRVSVEKHMISDSKLNLPLPFSTVALSVLVFPIAKIFNPPKTAASLPFRSAVFQRTSYVKDRSSRSALPFSFQSRITCVHRRHRLVVCARAITLRLQPNAGRYTPGGALSSTWYLAATSKFGIKQCALSLMIFVPIRRPTHMIIGCAD